MGGILFGLTLIAVYISVKIALVGFNVGSLWGIGWFTLLVLNAHATDLFMNDKEWVASSLEQICRDITPDEKVALIKAQLDIAVNRYNDVFMIVNGFDTIWKKLKANIEKILQGPITIKEVIVIGLYVVWDLLLRDHAIPLIEPWDGIAVFTGLILLKVIDAKTGFATIVAQMYKETYDEVMTTDKILIKIRDHIIALAHLFDIEYEKTKLCFEIDPKPAPEPEIAPPVEIVPTP